MPPSTTCGLKSSRSTSRPSNSSSRRGRTEFASSARSWGGGCSTRPGCGPRTARSSSTTCSSSPAGWCRPRPEIRAALHRRYQRLLLDEFQDTDPIQLEIAVRLAAAPDDAAHEREWTELVPLPGRLFIVGDPKQSIYRFRRADIAQYLRAADQVGADRATLSANFRIVGARDPSGSTTSSGS